MRNIAFENFVERMDLIPCFKDMDEQLQICRDYIDWDQNQVYEFVDGTETEQKLLTEILDKYLRHIDLH